MSDSTVDIKITTTADTSGAKAAASAITGLEAASKGGASAAQAQAKATMELGESYEKGAAAGRVLSEVSRGNIFAFGQLGAVFKAVGQAFKSNPLFLIGSLAATLILPVIAKIGDGWEAQKKKAENAGKASADAAGAALDAIEKKRDNASEKYFHDISIAAEAAKSRIEAVSLALVAQIDAEEAVALATVEANTKLSESEKLTAKLAISREARGQRDKVELDKIDSGESRATAIAQASAAQAEQRRREREQSGRLLGMTAARSPAVIEADLKKASQSEGFQAISSSASDQARLAEAVQRKADLEAELVDAKANYETRNKAAQARYDAAKLNVTAAERQAADDASAATTATFTATQARKVISIKSAATNQVSGIGLPAAWAKADGINAAKIGTTAFEQTQIGFDLRPKQHAQVETRATAINAAAAAQAGVQAGESIGEAFGMAVKELFPAMTDAVLRTTQAQINAAVKAEVGRLEAQTESRFQALRAR